MSTEIDKATNAILPPQRSGKSSPWTPSQQVCRQARVGYKIWVDTVVNVLVDERPTTDLFELSSFLYTIEEVVNAVQFSRFLM